MPLTNRSAPMSNSPLLEGRIEGVIEHPNRTVFIDDRPASQKSRIAGTLSRMPSWIFPNLASPCSKRFRIWESGIPLFGMNCEGIFGTCPVRRCWCQPLGQAITAKSSPEWIDGGRLWLQHLNPPGVAERVVGGEGGWGQLLEEVRAGLL